MNKNFKISTFLIILLYIFSSITINDYVKAENIKENNVNLVLDTLNYRDSIPKNFRKTTALEAIKDNTSVLVPEEKKIYLTFDDGPIPGVTEKLLDVLKEQNIKATFFVVGKEIPEREHILKRIYNEGHTIGLHTYNHKFRKVYKSDDIFIDEMLQTRKKINEILNISPTAIRFPAGSSGRMTQELLDKLHSNNMKVFDWTIDLHDGCSSGASVSELIRNGKKFNPKYTRLIILAHCNSNNINTVRALPEIIKFYKELGYEFAAIGEDTPDYYYRLKENKSKK